MRPSSMLKLAVCGFFGLAAATATHDATQRRVIPPRLVGPDPNASGFASVYGDLPADQAEFLSTPEAMKSAAASASATPTVFWEALEHGERVECLDCIPLVAPLLYDGNAKNREIAAWWLRRRVFGVFGTVRRGLRPNASRTFATDSDPVHRSYAAYALGEFLFLPGITACATALTTDGDARVRAAAASALGRLNDDGAGALGTALSDSDSSVKLAALASAGRVNSFSAIAGVAALTTDATPEVRRRAIEVLDGLHATDAVAPVAAVAQHDSDARVRAMACHALGTFGNSSVTAVLQGLSQNDPDTFVRDQAQIALLRL